MPLAKIVAAELRILAERLESNPDAILVKPSLYWSHTYASDPRTPFLAVAALLPRPLKKNYSETELTLTYESEGLSIVSYTSRNAVCEIIQPAVPAVYRCEPFLSDEEDGALALAGESEKESEDAG